jgi:hypothetical protein
MKFIVDIGKKTTVEITSYIGDNDLCLTNNHVLVLQETVEILGPFTEITSCIQSGLANTVERTSPFIGSIHSWKFWKISSRRFSLFEPLLLQSRGPSVKQDRWRHHEKRRCSTKSSEIWFSCASIITRFRAISSLFLSYELFYHRLTSIVQVNLPLVYAVFWWFLSLCRCQFFQNEGVLVVCWLRSKWKWSAKCHISRDCILLSIVVRNSPFVVRVESLFVAKS